MWKNIIGSFLFPALSFIPGSYSFLETNIMVATHADSMIAEAALKGITGFDRQTAWDAVFKDATVPPKDDKNTSYYDREEVPFIVTPNAASCALICHSEC